MVKEANEHEAEVRSECEPLIQTLENKLDGAVTKEQVEHVRQKLRTLNGKKALAVDSMRRRAELEFRRHSLKDLQDRAAAASKEAGDLRREWDETWIAIEAERKTQQAKIDANRDADAAIRRQKELVGAADRALQRARQELHADELDRASLEQKLSRARESGAEFQVAEQRLQKLDADRAEWLLIQTVCARELKGLELDVAAPAISQYANELLMECFGGRLQVQFQTLNPAGREVFDLLVTDMANGMSESLFLKCGGQKVIAFQALRLAIALHGKDRAGRNFETLFFDESESALAPKTRGEFVGMLRAAMRMGGFKLALIVTHATEVMERADRLIEFGTDSIQTR